MRIWRFRALTVWGLAISGCQEPTDLMVPVTPPGVPDRVAPVETGENAPQAVGETGRAPSKILKSKAKEIVPAHPTAPGEVKTTATGLKYETLRPGDGDTVVAGRSYIFNYKGTLENGTKFDEGDKRSFPVATGGMIEGWDQGVVGMKIGEKRKLIVPPSLGYGEDGQSPRIPPNATLIFEIEAVKTP